MKGGKTVPIPIMGMEHVGSLVRTRINQYKGCLLDFLKIMPQGGRAFHPYFHLVGKVHPQGKIAGRYVSEERTRIRCSLVVSPHLNAIG